MNPIVSADVDQVLDAHVFVCVPITGHQAGQPTLRYIKEGKLCELARHCLDRGAGVVYVTPEQHCCVAFWRDSSGGVAEELVDRIEVEHVLDTTGAATRSPGIGLRLPGVPGLRRGLPVRQCDGL
jgi:hypothetical protein